MALFPPLNEDAAEVRRLLAPLRNDLSIAIYNHGNPFSVGGIIRVAHSFLVREIFVIGSEPFYEKASMGMHRFETIHRLEHHSSFLQRIEGRPLWAIEKDRATRSLFAVDQYPRDVVLLFGSERGGLPDALLSRADAIIGIPMYGVNHSFPVAVAAGMVLCDWARRRYAPGTTL